jgi:hypothetical protein
MQVMDLKQATVTKQASVNNKHSDLDDKLFSRTASHAEMETPAKQALDLGQWLTEQTSVTNVKTKTFTMQHLREMTSKYDQDQSPRPTTRRTR